MADAIVYRYNEMAAAVESIKGCAEEYKNAAIQLENEIMEAISTWEGASRDQYVNLLQGAVHEFFQVNIPQIIDVVAQEVQGSIEYMQKTDQSLADSITQSIG